MSSAVEKILALIADPEATKRRIDALEAAERRARDALTDLNAREKEANDSIAEALTATADLVAREADLDEQRERLTVEAKRLEGERQAHLAELSGLDKSLVDKRDAVRGLAARESELEGRISKLNAAHEQRRRDLEKLNETIAQKQALLNQLLAS